MNRYGQQAMQHWRTWLPNRYAVIPDPQTFFAELGEQVEHQVQDLWDDLQAANPPTQDDRQDYLANLGRLNSLRQMAEEKVLNEMVLLPPDSDTNQQGTAPQTTAEPDPGTDSSRSLHPEMDPTGMPRDRDHPLWKMAEDDSVSLAEFRAAAARWEQDLHHT